MAKKAKKQVKKQVKKINKKANKKTGKIQRTGQSKTKKKTIKKKKQIKRAVAKPSVKKTKKKASRVTKQTKKKSVKKKSKANNPLLKPVNLSPELAAIMGGQNKLPRTEVIKKLWRYIKKHNLQDSKDRKKIRSNEKLKVIFQGRPSVNMFEMTKLISKHLDS